MGDNWQHHLSYFDSILTLFSEELYWHLFCAILGSHLKRLLCTTILANELLNYRVIINCHTQRQQCNVTWLRSDKIHVQDIRQRGQKTQNTCTFHIHFVCSWIMVFVVVVIVLESVSLSDTYLLLDQNKGHIFNCSMK